MNELTDEHVAALRGALVRAGFDESVIAFAESIAPQQFDAVRTPVVLHALERRADPAALLAALFCYGGGVDEAACAAILGAPLVAALVECGALAAVEGGTRPRLRSHARLLPFRGMWVASTEFDVPDPVMGPGATTEQLAHLLALDGVGSLLDIGCGAGTLALLARAVGVPDVVGVDVDPRAIEFARFNGRLNRLDCTWAVGDLSAPVRGRTFDAIVSQPAYVARPDEVGDVTFLHGGRRGDELALRLLGELGALLTRRGRFWVMFDTPDARASELVGRIRGALGDAAVDLCVLAIPGGDAATQAIAYASLRDAEFGANYREQARRYRAHFDALGIERVRHVVAFGRAAGAARSTLALEPAGTRGFDGDTLPRLLDAVAWSEVSAAQLLAAPVRPNPAARLVHEQSLGPAADERLWVRFERGAGIEQELTDTAAALVACVRDHQPLAAAVEAYAAALEATRDEVESSALAFVRRGLRSSLFVVEDGERAAHGGSATLIPR